MRSKISQKIKKKLAFAFGFLSVLIILYLIFFPFYPELKYRAKEKFGDLGIAGKIIGWWKIGEKAEDPIGRLPRAEFDVSSQRLIIEKIGVNIPIIESESSEYGLSRGAWHDPESSTPDQGGNTVITGHRFKYLPPSNLTFYLFHKLRPGDIASVFWNNKDYYYEIKEVKIVEPSDPSVLEPTEKSVLTMYTCHPVYSQDQRLVVVAELTESSRSE